MARLVKKKKKRLTNVGLSLTICIVCGILYLFSSLLINTNNASLSIKIQSMNDELASLRTENQTLNYEIQSLSNKDRVYEIAAAANLNQVQDNIISVIGE